MRYEGFGPVFDGESRVLILGSFPSVMSRSEGFYYGNPRNRFWPMLAAFFHEKLPQTIAEKRALILENHIALWDMVGTCEVNGSSDASISEATCVDLNQVLGGKIGTILCNGTKSFSMLGEHFPQLLSMAEKLPSTSPANPRYREEVWHAALARALRMDNCHKND